MKTTTQELKQYITRLFQLSNEESWECEVLDEVAKNILPPRFVDGSPLLISHSKPTLTTTMNYMT